MNRTVPAVLPLLAMTASPAWAAPGQVTTTAPKNCAELLARMPANSEFMRIETKKDVEAEQLAMHKRLDLNHDGFVTLDEAMQWTKEQTSIAGEPSAQALPMIRRIFEQGDANHDGKISAQEVVIAADAAFDRNDTNHDGKITPAERCAGMTRMANDAARQLKRSH